MISERRINSILQQDSKSIHKENNILKYKNNFNDTVNNIKNNTHMFCQIK